MPRLRGAGVALGMVMLARVVPARAQSQPESIPHTIEVKGDALADRRNTSFRDTGITRNEIERAQPMSLADPFRHAPSASVQQTSPSQVTIFVRGISGRELAHMVDGVRLNSTIFRAGNNPFIGLVDVYSLEHADIRPGANSVLYGADAIGGAVLMWTAVPALAAPGPRVQARLLQTLASNPLGGASRGDASYATSLWAFRLGVTHIEAGAIEPGGGELSPLPASYVGARRDPGTQYQPTLVDKQVGTEFQQIAGDATVRVKWPQRLSLIGRVQHSRVTSLVRYDQITPRFKSELPDRAESSLTPLSRTMAALELAGPAAGPQESTHSLLLSWQRLSERAHFRNLAEYCAEDTATDICPATSILLRDPERSIERNRTDAFGLAGRTRLTPFKSLSIATGASVHHELVGSSTLIEAEGDQGRSQTSPRFPDGSAATEAGVYAVPRLTVAQSLSLSVSGRASVFHVAIARRAGENPAPQSSLTLADWSSQALVEWSPIAALTVGASWGRALRPPNVQDLATQGTRARGRFQVPNRALGAEHGQSADVGFRFKQSGAMLQATLFYQRNTDAIVLAPTTIDGQSTTPEGDAYYTSINASSVESYGVEAQGRLRLHRLFSPFARWLAMQGEQSSPPSSGLPARTAADRVPPIQGELGFRTELTPALDLELMTAFRLKQDRLNDPTNLDDNRIPEGGTPGFVAYHARVAWRARRWLCARLSVDNITDELILEHGSGFYRPGFAATLMLELKLDDLGG